MRHNHSRTRGAVKPLLPFSPQSYTALVMDTRLSHGAFRLWHLLRQYADDKGQCWPGMRRLRAQLASSLSQIAKWRAELVRLGYLSVDLRPGAVTRYKLAGGVSESGNSLGGGTVSESGNSTVSAFARSVSGSGNETESNKPNPMNRTHRTEARQKFVTGMQDP